MVIRRCGLTFDVLSEVRRDKRLCYELRSRVAVMSFRDGKCSMILGT
jgi:hypothetical protein